MINSKEDYLHYLERDKFALHKAEYARPSFFGDPIWKFQILLRKVEYLQNKENRGFSETVDLKVAKVLFKLLSLILGFTIYPNNFGPGLSIAHRGTIVVNEKARIGANCRIHTCVNIGITMGDEDSVPVLGDSVYIGPGVKIYGKIAIANNIAIGANAVVNKTFEEEGITIAGVPARKISDKGSPGITIG